MDRAKADQWIAALRSGKYQQGTRHLHDSRKDSYCCLGVLCKTVAPDYLVDTKNGYLSSEMIEAIGIFSNCGRFKTHFSDKDDYETSLAILNDSGLPFNQIADLIDCFYEEL